MPEREKVVQELSLGRVKGVYAFYRVGLLIALCSGLLSVFLAPIPRALQGQRAFFLVALLFACYVLVRHSESKGVGHRDVLVFLGMNSLIFFGIVLLLGKDGVLFGIVLGYALLFASFFSMNKRVIGAFFMVYVSVLVYFLVTQPFFVVSLHPGAYIIFLASSLIVYLGMLWMVGYVRTQEGVVVHDSHEIEELSKREEFLQGRLDSLLNLSDDIIVDYDINTKEVTLSEATRSLQQEYGLEFQNPRRVFSKHVKPEDEEQYKELWDRVEEGFVRSGMLEVNFTQPFAGMSCGRLHILYYSQGAACSSRVILVVKDLSEQKEHAMQLYQLTYHDLLTGLPNREGLKEALQEYLDGTEQPCAMILADISGFQNINSAYGYQYGDMLLKRAAEILPHLALNILLVGRVGVDVFAMVVLEPTTVEDMMGFFLEYELPFVLQGVSIKVRFAVGISEYPANSGSAEDLLKHAEIALAKAKANHTMPVYRYDASFSQNVRRRVRMLSALDRAITNQEIYLVYQPKYSATKQDVNGYEALARWNSEEFGQVSPLEFVQLAEQSTLIISLERYILHKVCSFIQQIPEEKRTLEVSINISGHHLLTEGFVSGFCEVVNSYGITPSLVGIEITETALIGNFDVAVKHLEQLKLQGFRIYLDDFGTGYSSLSYLNRLPVDVLKIDRAFIKDIGDKDGKKSHRLLDLMIRFSKVLELTSVAEGVEEEHQYLLLKEMGCDSVQGYLFSKPLPEEEVLASFRS